MLTTSSPPHSWGSQTRQSLHLTTDYNSSVSTAHPEMTCLSLNWSARHSITFTEASEEDRGSSNISKVPSSNLELELCPQDFQSTLPLKGRPPSTSLTSERANAFASRNLAVFFSVAAHFTVIRKFYGPGFKPKCSGLNSVEGPEQYPEMGKKGEKK